MTQTLEDDHRFSHNNQSPAPHVRAPARGPALGGAAPGALGFEDQRGLSSGVHRTGGTGDSTR